MRVKSLSAQQRLNGCFAHDIGGALVTFAIPEGLHITAPHAGIGDFTDAGFFEI
ncbi:hypothetical protein D3C71_2252900 [compost metagenome]